jgi:hypothetical protein
VAALTRTRRTLPSLRFEGNASQRPQPVAVHERHRQDQKERADGKRPNRACGHQVTVSTRRMMVDGWMA